jgi:hypothetical protein
MPPFHNSNDTALDKTSRTNLDDSTGHMHKPLANAFTCISER